MFRSRLSFWTAQRAFISSGKSLSAAGCKRALFPRRGFLFFLRLSFLPPSELSLGWESFLRHGRSVSRPFLLPGAAAPVLLSRSCSSSASPPCPTSSSGCRKLCSCGRREESSGPRVGSRWTRWPLRCTSQKRRKGVVADYRFAGELRSLPVDL